ncbi:fasciclin domain-containing protein [Spirillospora sp. CA-253888]
MKIRMLMAGTVAGGLLLDAAACGGDGEDAKAAPTGGASTPAATGPAPAAGPFGPACGAVPKEGEGSMAGMADDPVATAASNNPVLSTLVSAVKKAGLVDTLNSAQGITVFAPTNEAFAKIPKADLDKVLADRKKLTDILTYHVVQGRNEPSALASGTFKTLQGGEVTTSGSGESYKVGDADVVCGGVKTSNATVYIIDTVLIPES